MRYYRSYMDRQEVSAGVHETLMNLDVPRKAPRRPWAKYGALAACAVLIAGIGAWKLHPGTAPNLDSDPPLAVVDTPAPVQTEGVDRIQTGPVDHIPPPEQGFVVRSRAPEGGAAFFFMPAINFQDVSSVPEPAASRAYAPGAFYVDLTLEDVQKLFWGPEGIPETYHTEIGCEDLPWALFWDGYTLSGVAWYDGEGNFTELALYGGKDRAGFTLELRLGALPFSCLAEPDRETSEYNGVEITGWSRSYDCDGDKQIDYICGSEFMTENGIGVRFKTKNCGSPEMTDRLDAECWFNTLFIRQVVSGGLHLDHLLNADHVPAWREASFDTLEQARREADFAPYLPTAEPEGYSAYVGNKDFHGHLSYQEGRRNMLFVRWSRGYDNVEVEVNFPEGNSTAHYEPVDINVPESYDARLYDIPWCDSVPDEYQRDFYSVTFRAEDMSLEAVMAREVPHDTGGSSFRFNVLHANGVVVSYSCDGMPPRQVWELVEPTLT